MSRQENEEVGRKLCKCGCGKDVILRKRHFYPSHLPPDFIKGHQQYGNKRGWKKGEIKQNGYIVIYSPFHPKANAMGKGYVKRSRLVMEKHIGRYLKDNEVIHHLNGIRDDDRLENLVITTKSEHQPVYHKRVANRNPVNGRFVKKEVMPYA